MRPALSLKSRERRVGFALTVPALLAFAVMILLPFVQSFRLAFYKFTIDMQAPVFVGLANFTRILSDPGMATVWGNTLVFVVLTTGLTLLLGLAWALVMNQTFWGRSLLRSLSLLPWVLPTTVTAFLAAWIFNGQYGVLNAALVRLGLLEQPVTWLAEPASLYRWNAQQTMSFTPIPRPSDTLRFSDFSHSLITNRFVVTSRGGVFSFRVMRSLIFISILPSSLCY